MMNSGTAKADDNKQSRSLFVSLTISVILILGAVVLIEGLNANQIVSRLLWPLTRLMLFITIGLLVGQIIEVSGWIKHMAVLARPLFRFGHLGDHCSAAFTTAFFSGVSANAMLLDFFKEGLIARRQLFLSNFINQLPAFFLHLPTTFFIVIPLTGWAGALYFLITFLAVVLRTVLFLVYGRLMLPSPANDTGGTAENTPASKKKTVSDIWKRVKSRLPRRIAKLRCMSFPSTRWYLF